MTEIANTVFSGGFDQIEDVLFLTTDRDAPPLIDGINLIEVMDSTFTPNREPT